MKYKFARKAIAGMMVFSIGLTISGCNMIDGIKQHIEDRENALSEETETEGPNESAAVKESESAPEDTEVSETEVTTAESTSNWVGEHLDININVSGSTFTWNGEGELDVLEIVDEARSEGFVMGEINDEYARFCFYGERENTCCWVYQFDDYSEMSSYFDRRAMESPIEYTNYILETNGHLIIAGAEENGVADFVVYDEQNFVVIRSYGTSFNDAFLYLFPSPIDAESPKTEESDLMLINEALNYVPEGTFFYDSSEISERMDIEYGAWEGCLYGYYQDPGPEMIYYDVMVKEVAEEDLGLYVLDSVNRYLNNMSQYYNIENVDSGIPGVTEFIVSDVEWEDSYLHVYYNTETNIATMVNFMDGSHNVG